MAIVQLLRFVWNHPLNKGNRLAALQRVVRWQIAARLVDGPIALPFVEGTMLLATRGATGVTGNWYCGLHEVTEMGFVLHVLRPQDHFLDVGANVGSYTVLAAGAAGAHVSSIEPVPSTFSKLERNIVTNRLSDRVVALQCGISDQTGSLRFTANLDTMNRITTDAADSDCVQVAVRTIDDVVNGNAPTVIKIDVEGHEAAALRGARRTLADPRLFALIVEINKPSARDGEVISTMRSAGFSPYAYDPFSRALVDHRTCEGNVIFVRDAKVVAERVLSSRRYTLINGEI